MDITQRKISRIARIASRFTSSKLKGKELGPAEYDYIQTIRKNPGLTQKELAARMHIDKAAIARMTASLERKGYIERRENPDDFRSRRIFPLAKAEELKNERTQTEAMFYEWLLDDLSRSERKELARLLDTLYDRCKQESKAGFPELRKLSDKQ